VEEVAGVELLKKVEEFKLDAGGVRGKV